MSLGEILLFPLVPSYGIRHLKKEGWENKVLGTIELFPVLGPIVSAVEGVVHLIIEKNKNSLETEEPENLVGRVKKIEEGDKEVLVVPEKPVLTELKERAKQHLTWKETFKHNALENFHKVQAEGRIQEEPPVLELSPEQLALLKKVTDEAYNCHPLEVKKLATLHGMNLAWVFSLKEIPGWVFKCVPNDWFVENFEETEIYRRQRDTEIAKEVVERENLTLLHGPAQKMIKFQKEDGSFYYVLAEQKFDILGGFAKQNGLFHYCTHDEDLKPLIQEYVRQLFILILETGYADVKNDNNPILSNGKGMAFIDMDTNIDDAGRPDPLCGLRTGCGGTGEDGILWSLTLELIESVEPLLREKLTDGQLAELHLEEIKEAKRANQAKIPGFLSFLKEAKVKTSKDLVRWQWAQFPWDSSEERYIGQLQERINKLALTNFGEALALHEERKFYIYESVERNSTIKNALERLKSEKKIFDWTLPEPCSRSPFAGNGFYVWC